MRFKGMGHRVINNAAIAFGMALIGCGHSAGGDRTARFDDDVEFVDENVPEATETVQNGEEKLAEGDGAAAKELFETAIRENPRDIRAYLGLGLACEILGEAEEAERAYRQAIEVDPEFVHAISNLGLLLVAMERYEEALTTLRHAIEVRPRFLNARINLAVALEESGDEAGAVNAYREAVDIAPHDAELRIHFASLLVEMENDEAAVAQFQRAIAEADGDSSILFAAGNGLRELGQYQDAVRALRMALEVHEGEGRQVLMSELALALIGSEDDEGAEEVLRQAIATDAEYAPAYYILGTLLANHGEDQEAVGLLRRCIELDPDGALAERSAEAIAAIVE